MKYCAKVREDGSVEIPAEITAQFGLQPGDWAAFFLEEGKVRLADANLCALQSWKRQNARPEISAEELAAFFAALRC